MHDDRQAATTAGADASAAPSPTGRRLPDAAHAAQPWRVHALTPDFALEDVWQLPGEGGPGDFPKVVDMICRMDPGQGGGAASAVARLLWAVRWKLGAVFGWDDEEGGLGGRVESLRGRLPEDLRESDPPAFAALPFTSLYVTDAEFAAEIANATMHGVLHLGWVPSGDGVRWRARMAVLVKPNGLKGKAYMSAIRPARHHIVYPAMMRQGRALWERTRG